MTFTKEVNDLITKKKELEEKIRNDFSVESHKLITECIKVNNKLSELVPHMY